MKRILLTFSLLSIILLFLSCNNEEKIETDKVVLNYSESLSNFREKILSLAEEQQTKKSLKNEVSEEEESDFEMTEENAQYYINSLNDEAYDIFYSLGVTSEDMIEFNNHDVVLGAMMLLDYNSQYEEEVSSSHDVIDCVSRALIGVSFTNWAISGKITTKAMGIVFLKQVARKALGPIGIAWTIYDFVTCMAELDYNTPSDDDVLVDDNDVIYPDGNNGGSTGTETIAEDLT
jgi:hypothetical protein